MILKHYGIIWTITRRTLRNKVLTDQYIGVAIEAFIKAIEGFDPAFNRRITTYAEPGIERRVFKELHRDRLIQIPLRQFAGNRYSEDYTRVKKGVFSFSAPSSHKHPAEHIDSRSTTPSCKLLDKIETAGNADYVKTLLSKISKTERYVLCEYVLKERTYKEIGQSLSPPRTRERIRQIHKSAIEKLQQYAA